MKEIVENYGQTLLAVLASTALLTLLGKIFLSPFCQGLGQLLQRCFG